MGMQNLLTSNNLTKIEAFHNRAARRILRNKQVRFKFCNIPNIEAFIICRTARYVGKITRSSEDNIPKRFLGAWIKKSKKTGGVQHSCNNNFAKAISAILPEKKQLYKQGLFKDWIPEAKKNLA
jgi:hypothetical protein